MLRVAIAVLLLVPNAWPKDYPQTAYVYVGRGPYVGTYEWQIRIDHRVYTSTDACAGMQFLSGEYPARIEKETIRLRLEKGECRLRVSEERPALRRGRPPHEASPH